MERGLALQAAVTWYPTIWRAHSQAWLPSGENYAEVLMAISRGQQLEAVRRRQPQQQSSL